MSSAVVAVFPTDEKNRQQRRRAVDRLAHEISLKVKDKKRAVAVVLLAGGRLAFPYPDTPNFHRLTEFKSSLLVGTYNSVSDPDRIRDDLEAALTEYYEGRVTTPGGIGAR